MWKYANPHAFLKLANALIPWLGALALGLFAVGLYMGLFVAPADYRQGDAARIMFVHVPAAAMSIMVYAAMVLASLFGLIWRHPVAYIAAKSMAPIGAVFTALALITGSIWGRPMWNTWWEWDPRLTFELILFFFYVGYIALWSAYDDFIKGGDATAILCLVGSIFAVLAKYSVLIWDEVLHQRPSLSMDRAEHMHDAFYYPLLIMIAAYWCYFAVMLLISMRMELRQRRAAVLSASRARADV